MSSLDRVTVLGAGLLGGQIAWHSAFKGKTVVVYDIAPDDAIERCHTAHDQYAGIYVSEVGTGDADVTATRNRLTFTTDLAAAVAEADLVIEAVPEIPDVKTAVYTEMAPLRGDTALRQRPRTGPGQHVGHRRRIPVHTFPPARSHTRV